MAHPVWRPRRRDLPGKLATQPSYQVIDRLRSPRGEARSTLEVDEHVAGVEVVAGQIGASLAQLPDVLAVEPVQFVGDIQPPVAALGPHRVWMLTRHDLQVRGVAAPGVPVPMLQPESLAQPNA